MNDKITGFVISKKGFVIRSKADAEKFLSECVGKGSDLTVKDLSDTKRFYVITRNSDEKMAKIGRRKITEGIFEPTIMFAGKEAIDMVYEARKSINAKFFSD